MKKGFTLIELLLGMAILVIMAAAASTFFFGQKTSIEVEEEARKISMVLKNARSKSISLDQGASWGVYFDNNADPFYEFFYGANHSSGTTTEKYYLPEAVIFTSPPTASTTEMVFSKRTGNLSSGTITIVIESANQSDQQRTITISPNGLVNVN